MAGNIRTSQSIGCMGPVIARTETIRKSLEPVAYECARLFVVRKGSAVLSSELGKQSVHVGDVVLLSTNTVCGIEPEDGVTITEIYMDTNYVIDQIFWRHVRFLSDRFDAKKFISDICVETPQIIHLDLDEKHAEMLTSWLDELGFLTKNDEYFSNFNRIQALWFLVADVIMPFKTVTPTQTHISYCQQSALPRHCQLKPLREEAREAAKLLRMHPACRWTLSVLAAKTHMSVSQLVRMFVHSYGKTPSKYLTMVRVEKLATLLRETDTPIKAAMRQVGWHSRGHASQLFKEISGLTPLEYRRLSLQVPGRSQSGH